MKNDNVKKNVFELNAQKTKNEISHVEKTKNESTSKKKKKNENEKKLKKLKKFANDV